jgi:hypothetical protein
VNLRDFKFGVYRQQYQYKSFLPEKINHLHIVKEAQASSKIEGIRNETVSGI